MIPIQLRNGLLFVEIALFHDGNYLRLQNMLLDTGSFSTIFATDSVESVGLRPEPNDLVHEMYGIGGSETVVQKRIQRVRLGTRDIDDLNVELGEMAYGIVLEGIIGCDLLQVVGAVIDLPQMEMSFKS